MYLPGLQTQIGGPGSSKILIRCLVYQMLDEEEADCLYMSRIAALYDACVDRVYGFCASSWSPAA